MPRPLAWRSGAELTSLFWGELNPCLSWGEQPSWHIHRWHLFMHILTLPDKRIKKACLWSQPDYSKQTMQEHQQQFILPCASQFFLYLIQVDSFQFILI